MAYEVEPSAQAEADLADILQFLYESLRAFGDDDARAFERAADRVRDVREAMAALGMAPHQGTLRPDLGARVRSVTKGRAILYFEALDEAERVHVLAAFYGGQDHLAVMTARLREAAGRGR